MTERGSIGERCDALVRSLRGEVFSFSVAKRAQIADIPDRRYYLRGVAFWAELKEETLLTEEAKRLNTTPRTGDKLTQGQIDFLQREYACGQIVFAGGESQLRRMILDHPPSEWYQAGWEEVGVTAASGLRVSSGRTSPTPQRPRPTRGVRGRRA